MKYITSVIEANKDIKHVIDINNVNVFVVEESKTEPYGNKKDQKTFAANGIKVSLDLMIKGNSSDFIHLAQILLAVEQVRFVLQSTGRKVGGEAA